MEEPEMLDKKTTQQNTQQLIFVTGNANKLAEAQQIAHHYHQINLIAKDLKIDEIQSNDPIAVVKAKARTAYQILKRPVVVHDSSWAIPSLNGFPGAYMHDIANWFTPQDWSNLMREHSDRTIKLYENVAYCDEQTEKCFQYCQDGTFADKPKGSTGNSLEKVVIFADGKTIAEHHDIDVENNSVTLQVWEEFFDWYRKEKMQ